MTTYASRFKSARGFAFLETMAGGRRVATRAVAMLFAMAALGCSSTGIEGDRVPQTGGVPPFLGAAGSTGAGLAPPTVGLGGTIATDLGAGTVANGECAQI